MPIRAADISRYGMLNVSTYPRLVDFPIYRRGFDILLADPININNDIMWHCRAIRFKIISSVCVICNYNVFHRYHNNTHDKIGSINYMLESEGFDYTLTLLASVMYMHPARIGVAKYTDDVLHISGSPYYIITYRSVDLEDVSQLSYFKRMYESKTAALRLPGWSRVRVQLVDIYITPNPETPHSIILSDWIVNHDNEHIRDMMYNELKNSAVEELIFYKVTNDETGLGYIEAIY